MVCCPFAPVRANFSFSPLSTLQSRLRLAPFSEALQMMKLYRYVGPEDIRSRAAHAPPGVKIESVLDLERTLHLARSGLGTVGARSLAESPHLAALKRLDVRDNTIGIKARQALRLRFGKGRCRF